MGYKKLYLLGVAVALLQLTQSHAQNVTSPYSILGIGDIETKDFGKYFGMGSTSLALKSRTAYNFDNPASLTGLDYKMMNFDMNMRGRLSSFHIPNADTLTDVSKDYAVRRISLAFKAGRWWALAAGLRPYSTVNYKFSSTTSYADNSKEITKDVDGNGGIYQVYVSNAFALSKHLSVGLISSFLFGTLETNTSYSSNDIGLSITKNEYNALRAFQFTGGLQYSNNISKSLKQQFGLILTTSTTMHGEYTSEYVNGDSTITTDVKAAKKFYLPVQAGVGYALVLENMFTLSADYRYYNWKHQSVNYTNSYISNASRFSVGLEYSQPRKFLGEMREKFFLQTGFSYETGYLKVQNKPLNDYAVTIGAGNNVSRFFSYYLGLEMGKKGSLKYNQISEKYTQFNIGVTFKDIWINTSKFGKYD